MWVRPFFPGDFVGGGPFFREIRGWTFFPSDLGQVDVFFGRFGAQGCDMSDKRV